MPVAATSPRGVRLKALVTGAAGFIGSHLTAALLDRGAEVTGLDCFTDYYPRFIKEMNLGVNAGRPGFRFIDGSLQHADLAALLADKTHVFHLAAQAGVRTETTAFPLSEANEVLKRLRSGQVLGAAVLTP